MIAPHQTESTKHATAPHAPPFHKIQHLLATRSSWQILHHRQAKETRRTVFVAQDRYIIKQFEIPERCRHYRRPWLIEHRALQRLNGRHAPRSHGYLEAQADGIKSFWRINDVIPGRIVEAFPPQEFPVVARLMAQLHHHGVAPNDANIANFVRTPAGEILYLDFGRAILWRRAPLRSILYIGHDLAKFRREIFRENLRQYQEFLHHHLAALATPPVRRRAIRLAARYHYFHRSIRKSVISNR